jgi:hypothetical protein
VISVDPIEAEFDECADDFFGSVNDVANANADEVISALAQVAATSNRFESLSQ